MGNLCLKTEDLMQYAVQQIDFHAQFKKKLSTQNGDFFSLLNFLKSSDVQCLAYIVKALFHKSLKKQVYELVMTISEEITKFKPPSHLRRWAQSKDPKTIRRKTSILKSINQIPNKTNDSQTQKDVDEIFSRSSGIYIQKQEPYYKYQIFQPLNSNNFDLKSREKQIQERLQKLSQALKGAQKVYDIERSFINESSRAHSFISKLSRKDSYKTASNNKIDLFENAAKISFQSLSPRERRESKNNELYGTVQFKKAHTGRQISDKQLSVQLSPKPEIMVLSPEQVAPPNNDIEENMQNPIIDKYIQIREFYEEQIAKYKAELQLLRNKKHIIEHSIPQQSDSKVFSSLLSNDYLNKNRSSAMRLCSAEVHEEIKDNNNGDHQTLEYGTKMTEVAQSHIYSEENQSNTNLQRKHAKSMIIRLFRDSKMFPIQYSKNSSPIKFIEIRQKIEELFSIYYTPQVYQINSIEHTNMIFLFEQRQPKKYCDYLRDYKTWILIGKVNQTLHIGAFINLKQGPKSSTLDSFLFSLPRQGEPYILKAKNKIMDPIMRSDYINFGDSEFRIRSGTKKVNLNLESLNFNFCQLDGGQPSTRRFSMSFGENLELQQLQIHEVVFASDYR